jgi:hypothetical protein
MAKGNHRIVGSRRAWLCALATCALAALLLGRDVQEPTVRIEASPLRGPRVVEKQTQTAVIRDYLEAWKSMSRALQANQSELLDHDFVGIAKEKLSNTIEQQKALGLQTVYHDRAHDISLVFYSPEGLSVQLIDNVEYELQLKDHDKLQASRDVKSRFVAVLSPTEVRWKIRVLQSVPQETP